MLYMAMVIEPCMTIMIGLGSKVNVGTVLPHRQK